MRANPLAQKIVASDIALGLDDTVSFYTPDNCAHSLDVFRIDGEEKLTDCRFCRGILE